MTGRLYDTVAWPRCDAAQPDFGESDVEQDSYRFSGVSAAGVVGVQDPAEFALGASGAVGDFDLAGP
jgi:hypothetical protein